MTDETLNNDLTKLRFLDENGENYPDWEEKQLNEVAKVIGGGTPKTKEETYWGGTITWITPADMGKKYLTASAKTITQEGIQNSSAKILPSNTIICSTRGTVGKFAIPGKSTAISQSCEAINLFSLIHNEFFYYQENKLKSFLNKVSAGSTFKAINKDTLSKFVFSHPFLPEQTKIAEFLSNLDERIEQQSNLVELLKKQKQGYSQRLFNGSLRFKKDDGTDYEDWEEKKLGDFLKIPNEKPAKNVDYNKLITVGWWGKGLLKSQKGGSFESGATNFYKRRKGQFVYGKQSVFNGALGIVGDDLDGYYSSKDNPALDFYGNIANSNFILNYMLRPFFYRNFEMLSAGTGSKRVKESEILKLVIALPSLPEQEKIANFLSSLDERIDEQLNKLEQLKSEKQAYMQKVLV